MSGRSHASGMELPQYDRLCMAGGGNNQIWSCVASCMLSIVRPQLCRAYISLSAGSGASWILGTSYLHRPAKLDYVALLPCSSCKDLFCSHYRHCQTCQLVKSLMSQPSFRAARQASLSGNEWALKHAHSPVRLTLTISLNHSSDNHSTASVDSPSTPALRLSMLTV
jgi:hypothetical protein